MRNGVVGSPDRPSDENSENYDKDVDEDGEWSNGTVTPARRAPSTRRKKKLSQCHSVHHKTHTYPPRIEHGPTL